MKAIRVHAFGGPDVLKLEEVPDPKPSTGEILLATKAIGVNPVDTYIRAGRYGDRAFPYTPGIDAAGVIDVIGPGVNRYKPGDRVYLYGSVTGTYAGKILAKESHVHGLPESLSFSQGAALGVAYVTAYFGLVLRGQATPRDMILIHGASGGVGIAALQLARALNFKTIGTAGSPEGLALIKQEGAHQTLNHRDPQYLDELMKLTRGKGVDLILEMLANENLGKDLKVLASHGRVVVIGSRGEVTIDPRDTMGRHADIRGMSVMTATEQELAEIRPVIGNFLRQGALKPVVSREFALNQAGQAHEVILQAGARGKIVLIP